MDPYHSAAQAADAGDSEKPNPDVFYDRLMKLLGAQKALRHSHKTAKNSETKASLEAQLKQSSGAIIAAAQDVVDLPPKRLTGRQLLAMRELRSAVEAKKKSPGKGFGNEISEFAAAFTGLRHKDEWIPAGYYELKEEDLLPKRSFAQLVEDMKNGK